MLPTASISIPFAGVAFAVGRWYPLNFGVLELLINNPYSI